MEEHDKIYATFDYTSFLGASCTKKWTFADVLGSLYPLSGAMVKHVPNSQKDPEERLWDIALDRLSSRRSDESNLINLFRLARQEGIDQIKLIMPYALEDQQIEIIEQKGKVRIHSSASDEFVVEVSSHLEAAE